MFGGRIAGSVLEIGEMSWIVLEENNGMLLCASKGILGRTAWETDSKQEIMEKLQESQTQFEMDSWFLPSISDYKRFRFLLWLDTDWWLSDQSNDGSIAYVERDGKIRWSEASESHGVRYFVKWKETEVDYEHNGCGSGKSSDGRRLGVDSVGFLH